MNGRIRLTEAGEMFLLAAHTMGPMPIFGAGCWPMVNRLRADGLVKQDPACVGYFVSTPAGAQALRNAGYLLSADPDTQRTAVILTSAQNWVCDDCGHAWWEADAYRCPACHRPNFHLWGSNVHP